ncbi:hypothetical protein [Salinibacterium sp. SWN1162]|uniref:hypothetical protein n=1 Tax=Salinibacterium sp. SWN1162 TaxID=2792053 RepID=UPI0018CF5541|nr:hypothetical protein [Salinibacterium sp. SWN1162]MBH0009568.1 hypothetical protein [Salinibacterium sp. SWN1162]
MAKTLQTIEPGVPKETGQLMELLGAFSFRLREKHLLIIVPLVAAVLAPVRAMLISFSREDVVDANGELIGWWGLFNFAIPVGAVLIAVAVVLDKIADVYDKRSTALQVADVEAQRRAAEDTAAASVSALAALMASTIRAATRSGVAHKTLVEELPQMLTLQAAKAVGTGTRATYFTLSYDEQGMRILSDPVHSTEFPRTDKPTRGFYESEQPGHSIWSVMNGADESPSVRHYPEEIDDLDWATKEYKTFISLPVKTEKTQFGMLSVNNAQDGSIATTQKFVILAMARAFALVLASDQEAQSWLAPLQPNDSRES